VISNARSSFGQRRYSRPRMRDLEAVATGRETATTAVTQRFG
jgi:hypothetical protein